MTTKDQQETRWWLTDGGRRLLEGGGIDPGTYEPSPPYSETEIQQAAEALHAICCRSHQNGVRDDYWTHFMTRVDGIVMSLSADHYERAARVALDRLFSRARQANP